MMKRVFLAVAVAAALAGCASGVKLDEVPVDDRAGGAVAPGTGPADGATSRGVQPVQVDPAAGTAAGPANVSRVIYFDYDSYVVKPEFQAIVDAHARFLKSNNRNVVIEGHTDERGGREYNLALGQRRSEAVRRALTLLGVPDSRIEAVSFGEEKPLAQGGDESAWSQNRRAEISYR